MALYNILTNRTSVNTLKTVYDNEILEKKGYSIKLSDINHKLNSEVPNSAIMILEQEGLINKDEVDNDTVLSITNKGKEFIEVFDQLVELFEEKKKSDNKIEGKKNFQVKYELTNQEKRILMLTYRISKEAGMQFIELKSLVTELYPYDDYKKKISGVSRYISKLEELKLMERKKQNRKSMIKVTENGFKTIKQQYLKHLTI